MKTRDIFNEKVSVFKKIFDLTPAGEEKHCGTIARGCPSAGRKGVVQFEKIRRWLHLTEDIKWGVAGVIYPPIYI